MLTELHVRNLGVIADLSLVLGPGMTAITGETGAGKTLVVEAVELLVGERADPVLVRPGAEAAEVEGRFAVDGDSDITEGDGPPEERVVARTVPRSGRSRAYIDGRMATVAELAGFGNRLVDLHGQHSHQSLLGTAAQRAALDRYAATDLRPLLDARTRRQEVETALAALGGDGRARAREIDLLQFQLRELADAGVEDADEDERLAEEEDRFAGAAAHRAAAAEAYAVIADDRGALDRIAGARQAVVGRSPFAEIESRLHSVEIELAQAASDLRATGDAIAEDPERLDAVRQRRRLLFDLRRKYGETLADVMEYRSQARGRLAELESHEERVAALERERAAAELAVQAAATDVMRARTKAAPALAAEIQGTLRSLAMASAEFEVVVGGEPPGDEVSFLIAANQGEPRLPLAKVASGGELSRAMLATRLVTTDAPRVLVFDEVDAGIGGQAAVAVGRALAELGRSHQVLVVTHLPQVAAFADAQVAVSKRSERGRTVAEARVVHGGERVAELSRMLSGQPESATAREHAEELLASASRERETASAAGARGQN